jgi:hypothetical protein
VVAIISGSNARTVIEMAHRGCRNAAALADAVMHRLEDEAIVDACGEGFVDAAHGSRAGGQVTYPCGDTRGILSDRRDRSPD